MRILNPILAVLVVTQALSVIFGEHLSYKAFEVIHEGGGMLLLIGIALHVVLNWKWVRASLLVRRELAETVAQVAYHPDFAKLRTSGEDTGCH
ncbi:MAG TPA: hypothetical protein PKH24_09140 [Sedimentisphaerales bacterium]|nr:hypothetical protein [Sedimentisphaerales bacterium]HNU30088.1 hypothetical protein [Sedimentisphaerales bacterium]